MVKIGKRLSTLLEIFTFIFSTFFSQTYVQFQKKSEAPLYAVSKILGDRKVDGQLQFFVQWEGYPESEATWEPETNLTGNCDELIENYHSLKVQTFIFLMVRIKPIAWESTLRIRRH